MTKDELLADLDAATQAGDAELAKAISTKLDGLKREDNASGITLKVGPLDTGIPLPRQGVEALAGMGRRFMDIGTLGMREKHPEAERMLDQSGWATAGGIGADLATLVGGGAGLRGLAQLPQVASKIPAVARGIQTVGQNMMAPTSVRNAALTAGTYGAVTTNGDAGDRAKAAALQGATGAVGQAIPNVIGAAIRPNVAPDVADLASRGVRLTPGQIIGGRTNIAEQKLMSMPFVGDMVSNARERSIADANVAVANEVLKPLGAKATKPAGRELIKEVQGIVGSAYDDVLPRLSTTYNEAVDEAINQGKMIAATAGKQDAFEALLKLNFYGRFEDASNKISGEAFKKIDSGLATASRNARSRQDYELSEAVEGVRQAMRATVNGAKADVDKLKAADAAYARLVRMETAAGYRGAKEGVFNPSQLGRAVESGQSRGVRARGEELMGPFADALERRVSTTFPNSGTVDRALLGGGLLGAGYLEPNVLLGGAAGMAAYSQPGQAVLRAMMTKRPEAFGPVADRVRLAAPAGGLLAPLLPINSGQ